MRKNKIKQQKSGRDMSINEAFGENINNAAFADAKSFIEDVEPKYSAVNIYPLQK